MLDLILVHWQMLGNGASLDRYKSILSELKPYGGFVVNGALGDTLYRIAYKGPALQKF